MSGLLQHLKVSAIADGADASQVQPSDWNAAHVFAGGNHGAIPVRDTTDATYGSNWLASVASGQVLISNGAGALPSWSGSLALTGALNVAGTLITLGDGITRLAHAASARLYFKRAAVDEAWVGVDGGSTYFEYTGDLDFRPMGVSTKIRFGRPAGPSQLYVGSDQGVTFGMVIQNTNAAIIYGNFVAFQNPSGTIQGAITGNGLTGVTYAITSDARLKLDGGPATNLTALRAVAVHEFVWLTSGLADRGVFAQEAAAVFPRAVIAGTDERAPDGTLRQPWMTDYSKFVPDLIAGWQDHDRRLADLEARRMTAEEAA